MDENLPDKIIELDQIRINRGLKKICKCKDRRFMIDTTNKRVICSGCGAGVDAYDALLELANNREYHMRQMEQLLEQRKQIASYKPHLVVIKSLEKQYRGRKMIPNCPRCHEPFYLEELVSWTGKPYADARIKKFKESQMSSD